LRKLLSAALIAASTLFGTLPVLAHQDPELAGYVGVPGGEIWYRLNGRQHLGRKAAIIAIHGGPGGTHRRLIPLLALADERPVILYDQLGTGNSTRHNRPELWTVANFVAEIEALRRQLHLTDVIILGHSWGGALAAEYAVQNRPGVRAVILSSPLLSTPQWMADNAKLVDDMPPQVRETIRLHVAMRNFSGAAFRDAERAFDLRHACRTSPCAGERYRVDGPEGNDVMYTYMWGPTEFAATGTLRNYDITPRLREIRAPTLMMCGEYDEARPETCWRFASLIPGAATYIIPGAAHMTMVENEAAYIGAVRKFIRDAGL